MRNLTGPASKRFPTEEYCLSVKKGVRVFEPVKLCEEKITSQVNGKIRLNARKHPPIRRTLRDVAAANVRPVKSKEVVLIGSQCKNALNPAYARTESTTVPARFVESAAIVMTASDRSITGSVVMK